MRLLAMIRKEFRQILRDPRTLALVIFTPALLLLVFGYVLSFDVKHIRTGIYDLDHSTHSRNLVHALEAVEQFDIVKVFDSRHEIDLSLDRGEVSVALVIPAGFGTDIEAGRAAAVQSIIDGSNSQTATFVQSYLKAFVQTQAVRLVSRRLMRYGYGSLTMPVMAQPRLWYNPELKSSLFLIPGLMVFVLMITCTISTALSIVREKERGSIEQLLVSPLTPSHIIIGKTVPYVFVALGSMSLILVTGHIFFDVSIRGSHVMLALSSTLFILAALAQGMLISSITKSQQVAYLIAALSSILPTFLLSGFVFPIRNMPWVIQMVTYIIPARYFVTILRAILIKGVGLETYWRELLALALFTFIVLGISTVRMARTRLS
jgi:ABC-2 type transport system permease protein